MNATCPCGAGIPPRNTKYCSKACSGRYGGGKVPPSDTCPSCGFDLTVDDNVYVGRSGPTEGHRRCRRCVLAKGRPDYVPGPKGRPKARPGARRPRPKPKPKPTLPVEPAPARRWLSAPGWTT